MPQKELHITCDLCDRPLAEVKTSTIVREDGLLMCDPCYQQRQSYLDLADEMNDYDVPKWNEADWDKTAVKDGKAFAEKHDLRWPPGLGDYDRYWDLKNNGEIHY